MNDPVSALLAQRERQTFPWRWAISFSLALHGAIAASVMLAPRHRGRALLLPRVEVRLATLPQPLPPKAGPARAAPVVSAPKPAPPRPSPAKATKRPVKPVKAPPAARPAPVGPVAGPPAAEAASGAERASAEGSPAVTTRGAVGLGTGGAAGGTEETFPYSYYLDRVLATVEGNWFRPPSTAGTRCRVVCRIERSGRVIEVGLEESSSVPAFDRAALRAVYAAAPFPPLPQGFGGNTLTLHLEFGP